MMSLTFGLFTQVSDEGPHGPFIRPLFYTGPYGPFSCRWTEICHPISLVKTMVTTDLIKLINQD